MRKIRGANRCSTHFWGCAVDIDPANNRLKWNSKRARLAQSEYYAVWQIVENARAVSLGRQQDRDHPNCGICLNTPQPSRYTFSNSSRVKSSFYLFLS